MFDLKGFNQCVRDALTGRNFGKERADRIINDIERRAQARMEDGTDAAQAHALAMRDVFDAMAEEARERAKRQAASLSKQIEFNERIRQGVEADVSWFLLDGGASRGAALARAAVAVVERDPRFTGANYSSNKEVVRGQLYAIFGDTLAKVGKGAFGRQKGKAHLPNIVKEVFGENTGDRTAKEFAEAWMKVADVAVDLFNQAGGSMRKLARYLPQPQNMVKMTRAGFERFRDVHMETVDWIKTRWPDGSRIKPEEREELLRHIFDTKTTDGAIRLQPSALRGRGRAVGNALEQNRFLHYKDGASWLRVQDEFGDGNVFELLTNHIEDMSHRIALLETFGPNPGVAMSNIENVVRRAAAEIGPREVSDADAVLKNKFQPMMETILRQNPMDPHSVSGSIVTGVSNILTSAYLGSASILAIPGDFMQTAMVRSLNKMGMFDGLGFYLKSIATDQAFMRDIATQSGFVMDEAVMSSYAATRWTGLATLGPAWTRRLSEATMRLSLMSGHTKAARWATQAEFMGVMQRVRDKSFDELPFKHVMGRYGITADEWDVFRSKVQPWQPRQGVNFLRPIDILQADVANKQSLYNKFQGMIFEESRTMVPEATVEAASMLRGTTRPDTLLGAIAYSFSMYKNFPVSFMMIYGRLGMTAAGKMGKASFIAKMIAGTVLVGALGTQLREVFQGRDPLPMDDPQFLTKSLLAGGGLSIWGDFLFSGVNAFGQGPQDVAAGPLISALGDTTNLVFGDVYRFVDALGDPSKQFESKTLPNLVEYAKRQTPGSNIWWSRLVMERLVWDSLYELADPKASQKFKQRMRKRENDYGNGYWWEPGQTSPSRAPQFSER